MKIKTNHITILFFVCILCLVVAAPVWSATYYVDIVNGTDDPAHGTAPGSGAWKTLHYAVAEMTNGDILNVAAGTYSTANGESQTQLDVTQSNIIIQGTAGTILDGGLGCTGWEPAFDIDASGVTIKNMKFTGFTCDGGNEAIRISNGSNNTIESCEISGGVSNGVTGIVFDSVSGSGNVVQASAIHSFTDYGVYVRSGNPTIQRNFIYSNSNGVQVEGGNPEIVQNTISDNVNGVYIYYTGSSIIQPQIINNLIYGSGSMEQGIYVYALVTGSTVAADIYHNTIYNGQFTGIFISQESPVDTETIAVKYNIITNFGVGIEKAIDTPNIHIVDYNNIYANNLYNYNNVTPGSNDASLDPKFVTPGSDFHLQATSLLIDRIGDGAGDLVTVDRDGGTRPTGSGWDMGCYEYGSTSSNTPPDKPTLVGPADEAVFAEYALITLKSSAFSDPDGNLTHQSTSWKVKRDDNSFVVVDIPDSDFLTEYTIDTMHDYLAPGLKYVWQVQHTDTTDLSSDWSDEFVFKIGTSTSETLATIQAGKSLGDFGMISIVHWPDNPDPQAVFNINYDPQKYRIGTWDPVQDRYIEFGQGLTMEPGRAYWILTREPLVVNFNGIPVSMTADMEVCLHTHPSTKMGWNMIAPPNKAKYLWNEVLVGRWLEDNPELTVEPVPVSNPVASTLINHRIWTWQNGAYGDHRLDENFVLEHYKGYWVKAIVEGAYLVFPESAQVAGWSTPRNTMLAWKGKAVEWMKSLLPTTREAIADNDLPPMPMESFDGGANPLFEGCFVQTLNE